MGQVVLNFATAVETSSVSAGRDTYTPGGKALGSSGSCSCIQGSLDPTIKAGIAILITQAVIHARFMFAVNRANSV